MPSTKRRQVTKKLPCFIPNKDLIEEYKRKVKCKLTLLKQREERALAVLDNIQRTLLASYSDADLQKTVGQLRMENRLKEEARKQNSAKDEGYITEAYSGSSSSTLGSSCGSIPRSLQPPGTATKSRRLSRSLTRSAIKNTTSSSGVSSMGPPSSMFRGRPKRSSSASAAIRPMYKTPASNRMANFPPITPKVAPNTPITVLRRPRKGEMILSLSGSPLLPGSGGDDIPSCNIPLEDGTLISLVPHKLRKSQFKLPVEFMAPDTYEQLAQLRNNLDIVCNALKANKANT